MNIVSKICFSKQCYSQIKIFFEKREIIQALYAWLSIQRKIRIEIGSKRAFCYGRGLSVTNMLSWKVCKSYQHIFRLTKCAILLLSINKNQIYMSTFI